MLRLTGGTDHRYIGDVIRAVDIIALRCDELSERVTQLAMSADDVARVLCEEVTELRAVVERLRTQEQRSPPMSNQ
jgi:tetrahydromethanopterin S-methyltransferase subunit B